MRSLFPPAVADGTVFVTGMYLGALDAATGQKRWGFGAEGGLSTSPAVAAGMVFVGSFGKHVYALDAATGQQRWAFKTGGQVNSLTVVNDLVFAASLDEYVYTLDAVTGRQVWASKIVGAFATESPAVAGEVVFVGTAAIAHLVASGDNRLGPEDLYALDAATGGRIWAADTGWLASGPSVAGGMVFVGSADGKVHAFGGETVGVDQETYAGVADFGLAEEHFNRGETYAEQGRLDEAIAEYQAALCIHPDLVAAHVGLGGVYKKQGRLDESLREYLVALRINPNYAKAHDGLGVIYREQNRPAEARREAELARQLSGEYYPDPYDLQIGEDLWKLEKGEFSEGEDPSDYIP